MSVPAHAPYDFVALENLKKNVSVLREYGIMPETVTTLKPILFDVPLNFELFAVIPKDRVFSRVIPVDYSA
jgi:hypothetical protein